MSRDSTVVEEAAAGPANSVVVEVYAAFAPYRSAASPSSRCSASVASVPVCDAAAADSQGIACGEVTSASRARASSSGGTAALPSAGTARCGETIESAPSWTCEGQRHCRAPSGLNRPS